MGAGDGSVLGTTKLVDHGADGERYNIVLLAEGFTAAQQAQFDSRCDELVTHLLQHPDLGPVMFAVNVHRINVASDESGAANPAACGDGSTGSGANPDTFFDATYCGDGELRRSLSVDVELVRSTATDAVPLWNVALLIVNDTKSGGLAQEGGVATTDLSGNWVGTAVHELGHAAFDLADEYDYRKGQDAIEPDQNQFSGSEPPEPNITTQRDRAQLKWRHLVRSDIPVPTMENLDCSRPNPASNVLVGDDQAAVGVFEGGGYFHCGIYRPAYECIMRTLSHGRFCGACREAIHDRLRLFMPPLPRLAASPSPLDFGVVPAGTPQRRILELLNPAQEPITGLTVEVQNPSFTVADPPATIASGETVALEVELDPQFVEGSIVGELVFHSNAEDVVVGLGAGVCIGAASSQVRVGGIPEAPLDFGNVVQGLTMYRSFDIMNFPLDFECGAPLEVELPALPEPFFYDDLPPDGEMGGDGSYLFRMRAPRHNELVLQTIWVGFTAPIDVEGSMGETLEILTSGADHPNWPLTLSAAVVPPPPLEAVLVLDRSGSMRDPAGTGDLTRRDVAVDAASLFVSMLRDNHRIGIVRYNHESTIPGDVLLELSEEVGESSALLDAQEVLHSSDLNPAGNTAIGQGMITGSAILDEGATPARVMVVLTDGRQNSGIGIEEARQQIEAKVPPQRVYAVGIGLDQFQREIQQIATANGGAAHVTGELTGSREFLLHKLYAQIMADVGEGALIRDPRRFLAPGGRAATSISVCEADRDVEIAVICRKTAGHPKYMEVWLEAPDGTLVDPSVAAASPGMGLRQAGSHVLFRITLGAAPRWEGSWKVWVRNGASSGVLTYTVLAAARLTDLILAGRLVQAAFEPGSSMTAVFEPRLSGRPARALPGSLARLERPDGIVTTFPLEEIDEGRYEVRVEDTSLVGAYDLSVELEFPVGGRRTTRFRQLTGVILPYPPPDRLKECCDEIARIRRLLELRFPPPKKKRRLGRAR